MFLCVFFLTLYSLWLTPFRPDKGVRRSSSKVFFFVLKCLYFIYLYVVEVAVDAHTCMPYIDIRGQSHFSPPVLWG